ncbi:MAG: protein arginine kinase [Gemmatimonadota bacterium]
MTLPPTNGMHAFHPGDEDGVSWMRGDGPHAEIILSTRIRLARNLESFPFKEKSSSDDKERAREEIEAAVRRGDAGFERVRGVRLSELTDRDLALLLERHLVTRELVNARGSASLLVGDGARLSLLVNEEDHLRIQSLLPGFQVEEAWRLAEQADSALRGRLRFAFHHDFGFLTSCPTNTGTGLRASVLIHLPALVLTREISKVLQGISQIGLTFRGLYGEGSDVIGNYFQISNQTTLGKTEQELVGHLAKITQQVVEYEENARQVLARDALDEIEDKVWRAYGILSCARAVSFDETMNLLSAVRLGVSMKLLPAVGVFDLNRLLLFTQSAHLERRAGRSLSVREAEVERAAQIREILSGGERAARGGR